MARDKFEYATRRLPVTGFDIDADIFNAWGEKGWELCGYDSTKGVAIFKRKKGDDE